MKNINVPDIKKTSRENLSRLIKGKRVALIGPSNTLSGSWLGELIDSYDVIVRLNRDHCPYPSTHRDRGSRTDILYTCTNDAAVDGGPLIKDGKYLKDIGLSCIVDSTPNTVEISTLSSFWKMAIAYDFPVSYIHSDTVSNVAGSVEGRPSTGVLALMDIISMCPSEVFVGGMSFYRTAHIPTYRGASREQVNTAIAKTGRHNPTSQLKYFRDVILSRTDLSIILDPYLSFLMHTDTLQELTPVDISTLAKSPLRIEGSPYRSGNRISIVVSAFNLGKALEDFVSWNEALFRDEDIEVVIVSDKMHSLPKGWKCIVYPRTEKVFSLSRFSNYGVRQSSGDIILKTDIDMVFHQVHINAIHSRCSQGNPVLWLTHSFRHRSPDNIDPYARYTPRRGAYGGGICMHKDDWHRSRGMNEQMQGYNSDDKEMKHHLTVMYGTALSILEYPAMFHMNHPRSRNKRLNPRTPSWGPNKWKNNNYRNMYKETAQLWGTGKEAGYWDNSSKAQVDDNV